MDKTQMLRHICSCRFCCWCYNTISMSNPEYQEIIQEYKEQVRILKQEVAELQDAGKAKDSANKRTLQKLEHVTHDLEDANKKIKELEENKD